MKELNRVYYISIRARRAPISLLPYHEMSGGWRILKFLRVPPFLILLGEGGCFVSTSQTFSF